MDWQFFRDQIWTFIGVIISLIAIIIPIIIYFFQKTKKNLSYEILSNNSVLSNKDKIEGKLKILYDEKILDDVSICEIKFLNNGNQSISSNDFEKTLDLKFSKDVDILSVDIINVEPENLNVDYNKQKNILQINPLLLNVKDYFVVKVLLSNLTKSKDIQIEGRIKDIKKINEVKDPIYPIFLAFLGIAITVFGISKLEALSPKVDTPWTNEKILAIILIVIGYGLVMSISFRKKYYEILKIIIKKI